MAFEDLFVLLKTALHFLLKKTNLLGLPFNRNITFAGNICQSPNHCYFLSIKPFSRHFSQNKMFNNKMTKVDTTHPKQTNKCERKKNFSFLNTLKKERQNRYRNGSLNIRFSIFVFLKFYFIFRQIES